MSFNRASALGMRLNIAAGTAVRFEPGEEKEVELVELGGLKKVIGFNNLVNAVVSGDAVASEAISKAIAEKFKTG